MIVKLALLLLLVVALTVVGRWRKQVGRASAPPIESARRCPDCDTYVFGSHPEPCARADCRFRSA